MVTFFYKQSNSLFLHATVVQWTNLFPNLTNPKYFFFLKLTCYRNFRCCTLSYLLVPPIFWLSFLCIVKSDRRWLSFFKLWKCNCCSPNKNTFKQTFLSNLRVKENQMLPNGWNKEKSFLEFILQIQLPLVQLPLI